MVIFVKMSSIFKQSRVKAKAIPLSVNLSDQYHQNSDKSVHKTTSNDYKPFAEVDLNTETNPKREASESTTAETFLECHTLEKRIPTPEKEKPLSFKRATEDTLVEQPIVTKKPKLKRTRIPDVL